VHDLRVAVRRMLPRAVIAMDLFHVVQLAVKMVGDVRRRAVRGKYGRRGRSGDPEYGVKNLLARNLEHQTAAQFARIIETLDADEAGQQIALTWIAKEKLHAALSLRARATGSASCERQVRDRRFVFYDWCAQNEAIPELASPVPSPAGRTRSSTRPPRASTGSPSSRPAWPTASATLLTSVGASASHEPAVTGHAPQPPREHDQ
jgi:hypothetical protein